MGTPVISSRGTAPGDLVVEDRTGYLVDPGDAVGLEESVRRFFALPDNERREMGQRGLDHYRSNFGRKKNLELLISIYREAMAEAGRAYKQ
jgi:glycosyltransferase involved in cell wall biosynthesis